MISENSVFIVFAEEKQKDKFLDAFQYHEHFIFEEYNSPLYNSKILDGKFLVLSNPKEGISGIGTEIGILMQRSNMRNSGFSIESRQNELKTLIEKIETDLFYWINLIQKLFLFQNISYVGLLRTAFRRSNMEEHSIKLYGPNYICVQDLFMETSSTITKVPKSNENYEEYIGMPTDFRNVLYNLPHDTLLCITATEKEIIKNCIWE